MEPSCGSRGCIPLRSLQRRKLRDAGALQGKQTGEKLWKLSPEQAETVRLRHQLGVSESRLKRSEAALDAMGKPHAFLETL